MTHSLWVIGYGLMIFEIHFMSHIWCKYHPGSICTLDHFRWFDAIMNANNDLFWNKKIWISLSEKMKLLPLLLSVSYVQSKESTIECADCYFSYVEVNGYITPMKGDQNCMTNPKIMPTLSTRPMCALNQVFLLLYRS